MSLFLPRVSKLAFRVNWQVKKLSCIFSKYAEVLHKLHFFWYFGLGTYILQRGSLAPEKMRLVLCVESNGLKTPVGPIYKNHLVLIYHK